MHLRMNNKIREFKTSDNSQVGFLKREIIGTIQYLTVKLVIGGVLN